MVFLIVVKHVPYIVEKKIPYEVKVAVPQPYEVIKVTFFFKYLLEIISQTKFEFAACTLSSKRVR